MTSYSDNDYNVMKYFAKFAKFIPHSIIMPSFMTIGSQMPELDWGLFCPPPPYKIGCQNTPYKLGLILKVTNFKLPSPKRSGTMVKNIFGEGHHAPPPHVK